MSEWLNGETMALLFDGLLVVSVVGLWILWWRQVRQRRNIERMLIEASTQLQEATLMLNQGLAQIRDLQGENLPVAKRAVGGATSVKMPRTSAPAPAPVSKQQLQQQFEAKVRKRHGAVQEMSQTTANISQVAQMLRLQREGVPPEKIAGKLGLPLAQVKLMLMLQSNPKV